MDILVCVKRVPATDSTIKVGSDGKSIDPSGVEFVPNPYDEFAVEEGIKTKEAHGGEVTLLSIGPAEAKKDLQKCLAMGADKAVLLTATEGSTDAKGVAEALAAKAKELNPQVIFVGKQSVDNDDAQTGPRMAALLGWACASDVTKLEIEGDTFKGERDIEGGKEAFEGKLPVVITCNKGLNEPRFANLKGIMQAKKKPFESSAAELAPPAAQLIELSPPPARPEPTILGEGAEAVAALIDKLQNEAKVL
ncbi:MAG: electron transfer flavoprotein subunit beta [Planctomycetota bacterium]|nr:MAG: electron transfer flavoprotein subunit beta [Planctomycetota bacterium]